MVSEFIIYHLSFIILLPLSLFMFWFLTDDAHDTLTTDDDTFITDFLDGWADFHRREVIF